jgi:hypothetical protein
VGARVFGFDPQGRILANSGGGVLKLGGDGSLLSSNTVCPLPGLATTDGAGNYYFAGVFDGTQDFGGIVLIGGITNDWYPYKWSAGKPSGYLARYATGGTLDWVIRSGFNGAPHEITDIVADRGGTVFVGYIEPNQTADVLCVTNGGKANWEWRNSVGPALQNVRLGALNDSGVWCRYIQDSGLWTLHFNTSTGFDGFPGMSFLGWNTIDAYIGIPVVNDAGQPLTAGLRWADMKPVLVNYGLDGSELATWELGSEELWTLARDTHGTIYLGGSTGLLVAYDAAANLLWSTNYPETIARMLLDEHDNRFLSFADGSIARLSGYTGPLEPRFARCECVSEGIQFALVGKVGQVWELFRSDTLPASQWTSMGTFTNTLGELRFVDTNAPALQRRFFRASVLQ